MRLRNFVRAHVAGHDDDRIAEVHRATLAIGQATFFQNLQQNVEDIGVRFLDLVKQHHRVRALTHGLRKLTALVEAHVARRRTHQARHAVLFHIFGHVEGDKRVLGVEQELRKRLGKLGFSHAGRTQENKRTRRSFRVFQACARTTDGLGQRRNGFILANDALVQHTFHAQQLRGFRFRKVGHRHARGHGHHIGHFLFRNFLDFLAAVFRKFLYRLVTLVAQLFFLVAQLRGLLVVLRGNGGGALFGHLAQLFFQRAHFFGQHHVANAHARARLVNHVNGLVGQETILDVALGQRHRRLQRFVGEVHVMMRLVAVAQAFHNANGLFRGRFGNRKRLEATRQGTVLLKVLAEFFKRGSANNLNLATAQRRLQNSRSVNGTFGGTGTDQRVDLVDEQDNLAVVLHFLDAFLQALFEFTAKLAARNQRGHVQRDNALATQKIGHLIRHDELGQSFHHGGFAHTRLAQQQRVVLLATRQNLHHALYFFRAADNRVQLAIARFFRKIGAEFLQDALLRGLAAKRIVARQHGSLPHQVMQHATDVVARHAQAAQHVKRRSFAFAHYTQQQVLGGNVALAHLQRFAQGVLQNALHTRREVQMP